VGYRIEVLSPLHIGSGKKYKPIDYIEKKDEVLIFDEQDVIEHINPKFVLDNEMLRTISSSGSRREYFKNLDYLIDRGIINKRILSQVRISAKKGCRDLKTKEIDATMRDIYGPYIPGSTIKGLIRTAIFYDYVMKKGINYIQNAVKVIRKNYKLTIDDIITDVISDNRKKDISKDPFRFLSIQDVNITEDRVSIEQESLFNIDTSPYPGNVIEVIIEDSFTEVFKIKIRINEEQFTALGMNDDLIEYFNEEKILEVLHNYSRDLLEEEINYFKVHNYREFNTQEIVKELKKYEEINTKETPVIRIGKSTGYLSHTIGLAVKKLDPRYYEGEFLNQVVKPPKRNEKYSFPKTRKFIGDVTSPKLLGFAVMKKVD